MCCGRSRPSACSAGRAASRPIPRRRESRFAASDQAGSAARSCWSTACPTTTRSAAGCTGPACRSRAPIGSRWLTARRRVSMGITRWAASSTSSRTRPRRRPSKSRRSTAAAIRPRSTSWAATSGASSGLTVDGNVFNTDGYYIVRENERGKVDNKAAAEFWNLNVKAGLRLQRSRPCIRARRLFRREPRQRQGEHDRRHRGSQRHDLAHRQRRGSGAHGGIRASCKRRSSPTSRPFTATFLRCRPRRRRATSAA